MFKKVLVLLICLFSYSCEEYVPPAVVIVQINTLPGEKTLYLNDLVVNIDKNSEIFELETTFSDIIRVQSDSVDIIRNTKAYMLRVNKNDRFKTLRNSSIREDMVIFNVN